MIFEVLIRLTSLSRKIKQRFLEGPVIVSFRLLEARGCALSDRESHLGTFRYNMETCANGNGGLYWTNCCKMYTGSICLLSTGLRSRLPCFQLDVVACPQGRKWLNRLLQSHNMFSFSRPILGYVTVVNDDSGHYPSIDFGFRPCAKGSCGFTLGKKWSTLLPYVREGEAGHHL